MTKVSRGIRNHNPGNIRKSKDKWQGLADSQPDAEFFTFKDPTYGIRAMARLLINYQDDYGLNTVAKIINRWAPPVGRVPETGKEYTQNTSGYAKQVALGMGVGVHDVIDVHNFDHLEPMIRAMIKHENNLQGTAWVFPYTDSQVTKGLVLAGVEPKKQDLKGSTTIKASQVAAGATAVSVVAEIVDKTAPAFPLLGQLAEYAPMVLGIITIAAIGYIVYARIEDRKKGLR